MIKYVLIYFITLGNSVEHVRTQEFNSHKDCVHAGKVMEAMMTAHKHQSISWNCVPNGE